MGAVQISSKWASRLFSHEQDCIYTSIHSVLDAKPWAVAFDSNGLSRRQGNVSDTVLRGLQLQSLPPVESTRPAAEVVQLCFPRRARVPFDRLWRPLRAMPLPLGHEPFVALASFGVPVQSDQQQCIAFGHALAFADQYVWVHHNIACGDT